ncbi:MAG: hypothetical protein ACUVR1_07475 [Fimbriimonadales bacterium]
MKQRLIWITAISAVAAIAYAQALTVRGAFGFGYAGAPDADRPNAQFSFSVKQAEFNAQTRLGGGFAITVRDSDQLVTIYMPKVEQLTVDTENKQAEFSGAAYAFVRTRQGYQRARGTLVVSVADLRNPRDGEGDPDTITVAFYTDSDSEEPTYTYQGVVLRGDIVVFEETRSR